MHSSKNLPEAAFFSAEEKVQLLRVSGNCPRNLTKERLKAWLSFRKGTRRMVVRGPKPRRLSYLKGKKMAVTTCPAAGQVFQITPCQARSTGFILFGFSTVKINFVSTESGFKRILCPPIGFM